MPDSELELLLKGPDAKRLAAELSDFMESEFGTRPRTRAEAQRAAPVVMRGDPIAITALVLAVPSAALAAVDLAGRLELKQKVDRLVDWVRRKAPRGSGNEIELRSPEGPALLLDRAETHEVLELTAEISVRVTRRRDP